MKKRIWMVLLSLLTVICLAFAISACSDGQSGNEDNNPPSTVEVTEIVLDNTSLNLYVGNSQTLTATVLPSNATNKTVSWTSSEPTVATVTNGAVSAIKVGTTVIVATAGGKSATCTVTVSEQTGSDIAVTNVTLDKTSISLYVGDAENLTATVLPSNATNKTVSWSSSDTSVATVANGTVTALKAGTTTITATAGGKNATCTVTVSEQTSSDIAVTNVTLDKTSISLYVGDAENLTATVLPSNATNKTVSWSSSEPTVATVANGTVTALKAGTTTITATAGGKNATCTVTVAEHENEMDGLVYVQFRTGYAVSGYEGTDTKVTVPAKHDGKSVLAIGTGASDGFAFASNVTEIILPDTIQIINAEAFSYCAKLTKITMPSCLSVGNRAFANCAALTEIAFPENCLTYGDSLFENCNSLKKVVMACGVISDNVFKGCASVTDIEFGSAVTSISKKIFDSCVNLTNLTLANVDCIDFNFGELGKQYVTVSVTNSSNFFADSYTYHTITVGGKQVVFGTPNEDANWYYNESTVSANGKIAQYTGEAVEVVSWTTLSQYGYSWRAPSNARVKCYYATGSLEKITITEQQLSLQDEKLVGAPCKVVVLNRFPVSKIEVVGQDVVYVDEFNLSDYKLNIHRTSGEVDKIDFKEEYLSATDLAKLKTAGEHTVTITVENHKETWNVTIENHEFENVNFQSQSFFYDGTKKSLKVVGAPEGTTITYSGNDKTAVGEYTVTATLSKQYYNTKTLTATLTIKKTDYNITYVYGLSDVKNENPTTYNGLAGMTLVAPERGGWEFVGWYSDSDFRTKVTKIEAGNAGDITLYAKWKTIFTIKNGAITGLTDYGKTCSEIIIDSVIDGVTINSIGDSAFKSCSNLTSVTIGNGITTIGNSAFYGCSNLMNVTIPDSVTTIGSSAFYGCSGLTSVTIPDRVITIDNSAFHGCRGLTSVIIPDSVATIGSSAFRECSELMNVTIGSGVTSIGDYAFYNCSKLTSVKITDLTAWCKIEFGGSSGNPLSYAGNLYLNNGFITNLEIPDSVTTIGSYAFYGFSGLTSVTIGNGVTTMGSYAFSGCSGLISVTIPDSVTTIDSYAFRDCNSLASVITDLATWCKIEFRNEYSNPLRYAGNLYLNNELITNLEIPDSVTTIGSYAFYGFSGLTSVTIPNSVTTIGSYAFENCSGLTGMTIGKGVTTIGNGSFKECSGLTNVKITDLAAWCEIEFGNEYSNPLRYIGNLYINNELITNLKIPNSVTTISSYAFYGCSGLASVTIPNNVTTIGSYAFYGCSGLTSIEIPDSVTTIDRSAFYGCSSLESITLPFVGNKLNGTSNTHFGYIFGANTYSNNSSYVPKSLKTVVITGGSSIGSYAFYGCSGLTSVTIPDSVTTIGSYAFFGCSSLESITLPFIGNTLNGTSNTHFGYIFGAYQASYNSSWVPQSLKTVVITGNSSIGGSAFYDCSSLTSVTVGNSVTTIGASAFYGCSGLTSVTIGSSVTTIGNSAFEECGSLTSVTIPGSVSTIDTSAFYGCSGLTSVIIGNGVTMIGPSAFRNCSGLTSIEIPDSVTTIGAYAFKACNEVTNITIGNGITTIGNYAFSGCTDLETVYWNATACETVGGHYYPIFEDCAKLSTVVIGDNVTLLPEYAFDDCSGLTAVYISDLAAWCEIEFGSSYSNPLSYAGNLYLKNELITNLEIPDNVTTISKYAFYGYSGLTSATIGRSVTTVGSYAFCNCSGLTSVAIPNNVTTIDTSAFYGCSGLTSIEIPDSVTTIDSSAFYGCSSLESITLPFVGNTLNGTSDTHFGYIFGASTYSNNSKYVPQSLKTVVITGGSSIDSYAFSGCSNLTSVTIGNNITTIGSYAFEKCSGLTSVTIGNGVTSIDDYAFDDCSGLTAVYINDLATWCEIEFGSSYSNPLRYAGNLYLKNELITNLKIPNSVTTISSYAFYGCSGLASVTIPNNVTTIGSYAFSGCSGLTSVTIPDSVTTIDYGAFSDCSGLTSVTIPDSVTTISTHAFSDCSGLTSIEIPDSVTTIGFQAFYGCSGLTSVTIGKGVTTIDYGAFSGCSSLTSVVFEEPDGWWYSSSSSATSGTSITGLDKPDTAARYLTSTYRIYYWKRS